MRDEFKTNHDNIRRLLMLEPRGHKDMFGSVICTVQANGFDAQVFFMDGGMYKLIDGD